MHKFERQQSGVALVLLSLMLSTAASAEQGILVVHVSDPLDRPVAGISIGTKGDGSMEITGDDGKARIRLAADTAVGTPVTLMLGPQDELEASEQWVFKSPENGRTSVPSFENESENFVPVVLIRRRAMEEVAAIVEGLVASRTAELERRESEYRAQIEALTDAVQALAVQRGETDAPPGIEEALDQLAKGETEAAERIFNEVLERESSEAATARREAAAAARHLGALAFLHDTQEALGYYRRAVELDPENPRGWNPLGHLLLRIGELAEAEAAYEKVRKCGKSGGDRSWMAAAVGNLGLIYYTRGELERAEDMHRKALEINQQLGSQEGMAADYGNLGIIYHTRGDFERAEEMLRQALEFHQQLGSQKGMAIQYGNLGAIYRDRGEPELARTYWQKARDLFAKIGARPQVAQTDRLLEALDEED